MSDSFVESAKGQMGAIEGLIKGLPGIKGYVDKELRRDADKRVRTMIAGQLEEQKQALFGLQQKLLKGGGLALLDEIDGAIQKLQILIDRIKTASQGYAGLFDAVRIREEQLDALNRFDVALASRVVDVQNAVQALGTAIDSKGEIGAAIQQLANLIVELGNLFSRRAEAVLSPDLLIQPAYAPEVDPKLTGSQS
jgi:hypothetical protein